MEYAMAGMNRALDYIEENLADEISYGLFLKSHVHLMNN